MEQESRMRKFLMGLPFWWMLLTAVYIGLTLTGGGYVTGLFGLFVPIGIGNLFFFLENTAEQRAWVVIIFPLVLLTIFGGEWALHKWNLSITRKIFVILGILFALTMAVDIILWGNWQSLKFLMDGGSYNKFF